MRGLIIFICGALAGLFLETDRPEISNPDVFMLNHIGINVDDIDESLAFYEQKMGFERIYGLANEEGEVGLVYLKVGENTFLELNAVEGNTPRGFTHVGIQVEDIETVKAIYQSRGAAPTETFESNSQALRSFMVDPQGVPVELFEYPPDSELGNALAGE
jgi:lactoylglutathione lyase